MLGLTAEEREAISKTYDKGDLKAGVATCNLIAGIYLPARQVVLHGALRAKDHIESSLF